MTKLLYTGIENKLISSISTAKKNIKVAVAWFTNPKLYNAILDKKKEGVIIQLLLSDDQANFTNENVDFQNMIDNGIVIRITKSPHFMHNKFCVIDDAILFSGSYNWTLKAERLNFENVIYSEEKILVQQYQDYFDLLKFESQQVFEVNKISFSNYEEDAFLEKNRENKQISKLRLENNKSIPEKYSDELIKYIDKAEILYKEAKLEECLTFTKSKIIEYPEIPELYFVLTQCYWRMKNYREEMIRSAEKVLVLNELFIEANNFLGIGFSEEKATRKKALLHYNKCLEAFPDSHEYLVNRARCYKDIVDDFPSQKEMQIYYDTLAIGDYKLIKKIIKDLPGNPNYSHLYSLAVAEANLGEFSSALKNVAAAISEINLEPDIWKKDMNDYGDMKKLQYNLKTHQKETRSSSRYR